LAEILVERRRGRFEGSCLRRFRPRPRAAPAPIAWTPAKPSRSGLPPMIAAAVWRW